MRLAESSSQKLEAFFREHLHDANFRLPVIYFYAGKLTHLLTVLIGVHGITFGRHIFVHPRFVSLDQNNRRQLSADLAAHEIAHTLQYARKGFIRFLYRYLADYRSNLRKKDKRDVYSRQQAYLEIPFEIEAREVAASFIDWKKRGKF